MFWLPQLNWLSAQLNWLPSPSSERNLLLFCGGRAESAGSMNWVDDLGEQKEFEVSYCPFASREEEVFEPSVEEVLELFTDELRLSLSCGFWLIPKAKFLLNISRNSLGAIDILHDFVTESAGFSVWGCNASCLMQHELIDTLKYT